MKQRVAGRNSVNKILANIFWLSFDRVLRLLLGLFVGVWVVRYLGPQQFGALNYSISLVAIFAPLISLGLDCFVVRDLVRLSEKKYETLGTAFVLKFVGALFVIPLSEVALLFLRPDAPSMQLLVLMAGITGIFQTYDVFDYWFQSQILSIKTVLSRNAAFVIASLLKVLFIYLQYSVLRFAFLGFLEAFLAAVFLYLVYSYTGEQVRLWRFSWTHAIKLMKESWPYLLAACTTMIYYKADQIIIGKCMNDHEVGIYCSAGKILDLFFILTSSISTSVLPKLAELHAHDTSLFESRYRQLTRYLTILGLMLAGTSFILSEAIVTLLFGKAYIQAAPIMRILSIGTFFTINASLRGTYLAITSNQKYLLLTTIPVALLNVAGNSYVIPRYGIHGAAVISSLTQCFSLWISNLFFPQIRHLFWIHVNALLFWRK